MNLIDQLNRIDRIDQLIRLKNTGTAKELAEKLAISERQVYNIINILRFELNAPIEYNKESESYIYKEAVKFKYGFLPIRHNEMNEIVGGGYFLNIFLTEILFQ